MIGRVGLGADDPVHPGVSGTLPQPIFQCGHRSTVAMGFDLHPSVRQVPDPPRYTQMFCLPECGVTKTDALHPAFDEVPVVGDHTASLPRIALFNQSATYSPRLDSTYT